MLGQRKLFQSLFVEDEPAQATVIPFDARKGRREDLKLKQNEMIICRYYYHIKLRCEQYEKALEILEGEVYLAKRTIINIVNENCHQLKTLQQLKPELKYFRTKYPFMSWSLPL